VSLQRQQKVQAQQINKLKKEQQVKLSSLKKSDIKKQQHVNTLKSEIVKRDRIMGHKDKEITRVNSKLKACEDHVAQLLKLNNRNRVKNNVAGGAASVGGVGAAVFGKVTDE
jgi:SMC interacting uncharacterized protein involved in chromosome segregation